MILTLVMSATIIVVAALNPDFGTNAGYVLLVLIVVCSVKSVFLYWQDMDFRSIRRILGGKSRHGTRD